MPSKHEIEEAAWKAAKPEYFLQTRKGELIMVDRDDWHIHSLAKWRLNHGHVCRHVKNGGFKPSGRESMTTLYLWRAVTGSGIGTRVKYKDGNPLNCRKGNLIVKKAKNTQ